MMFCRASPLFFKVVSMLSISDLTPGRSWARYPAALMVSPWPASRHDWWLDGTVKSVERRISNLEVVRGMSRSTNRLT